VDIAFRPANKSGHWWTSLDDLETLSRCRDRDPGGPPARPTSEHWTFTLVDPNGRDNNDHHERRLSWMEESSST